MIDFRILIVLGPIYICKETFFNINFINNKH